MSPEQAAAVEERIQRINATAAVVRTQRSSIDLSQLLGRRSFLMRDPQDLQQALPGTQLEGLLPQQPQPQPEAPGALAEQHQHHGHQGHQHGGEAAHVCDEQCGHVHGQPPAHYHDAEVTTVSLRSSQPVALEALRGWLDQLLWERQEGGPDVYRMKGVLLVEAEPRCHMLQAVYELYDIVAGPSWEQLAGEQEGAAGAAETRIVVIGRRLDRRQLQQQLDAACGAAA